ncbi:DNA-binding CsgD family transcriptional regulator [Rhizobium aquaticum]|uniref:DNA-binding CsgD family transcriptional regulator n=1 Tax=Rhizobium aquaticum TaxID=1549636 RepID=A0ABV2J2F3_9HYPH
MDSIIDRIYESAFIPEIWPRVLSDIARFGDAEAGILFALHGMESGCWTSSTNAREPMEKYLSGGFAQYNVRPARGLAKRYTGFMADTEVMTLEEINSNPIYEEILRPAGFGWSAGSVASVPTGDLLVFSFERRQDRGPFDRPALSKLDTLRPHLARSALFAGRLHLQRIAALTQAMSSLGLPAAALDSRGKVLLANDEFHDLKEQVSIHIDDRLLIASKTANQLLRESLEALASGTGDGGSIPIPAGADGGVPMVAHIVPIRRGAHDVFARAVALLIVTRVERPGPPQADLLGTLFDLTPAEDRVARHLADGLTIDECARTLGVTIATVKTQIRSIFNKTGTARQSELLQLIASTAFIRRP